MKHIPISFLLTVFAIIVITVMSGVYAIAEGASNLQTGNIYPGINTQSNPALGDTNLSYRWYESAAIWACPLH